MSANQALIEAERTGSGQNVTIDGTARRTIPLTPGRYLITPTADCFMRRGAVSVSAADDADSTPVWARSYWFETITSEDVKDGKCTLSFLRYSATDSGTVYVRRVS